MSGRADKHMGLQTPRGDGQSQGGAYPCQEKGRRAKGGFSGRGGQSVQAYHGPSNPNATSNEDE